MKKLSIAVLSLLLFIVFLTACATATPPSLSAAPDDVTASPWQYGSSRPDSQETQAVPVIIVFVLVVVGITVVIGVQKRAQRDQNWRQLADELNAKYIEGQPPKIQLGYKHWTITLDLISIISRPGRNTSVNTYTRLCAPYVDKDGFQFLVYKEGFLWTGAPPTFRKMDEFKTGATVSDDSLSVRATNPATAQTLLANSKIHDCISQQFPTLYRLDTIHELLYNKTTVHDETLPEGVNEVYLDVNGWITDIDQIKSMFELAEEMLDQLCVLGSATDENPYYIN